MSQQRQGKWPKIRGKKNPRKETLLYIEDDMWVPWASTLLNVSEVAWDRKKKESDRISGAKNNPRKETFIVHRGWHMGPTNTSSFARRSCKLIVHRGWHAGPMCQQLTQCFQGGSGSKEKGNSQNQRVKNKSNKGEVYCPWRLTSGTHEPAASSTFRRRLGIERKKANSQKLGVQNNSKKGSVSCS